MNTHSKAEQKCRFCGKEPLSPKGDCLVCEKCKVVARASEIDDENLFHNINATLDSIQKHIDELNRPTLSNGSIAPSYLYTIGEKCLNQKDLKDDERAIADYCLKFVKCKSALQLYMREKVNTNECFFRQELYSLLDLSERFKGVFGNNDFVKFTMN